MYMKTKRFDRALPLLLAALMLLSLIPVLETSARADTGITVTASVVDGDVFRLPSRELRLTPGLAAENGYTYGANVGEDDVTTLDALVAAHIEAGLEPVADYLSVSSGGSIGKLFGIGTYNVTFLVNSAMPANGDLGYMVNEAVIDSGDKVEFIFIQDDWWSDLYAWFELDGVKTESLTVEVDAEIDLTLNSIMLMWLMYPQYSEEYLESFYEVVEGVKIGIVDTATGAITQLDGKTTDDNGEVTLSFDTPGTYIITAFGEDDYDFPVVPPRLEVTVLTSSGPADATVYVSISSYGGLVEDKSGKPLALAPVTLTGKDSYTIDDALRAAHEAYHPDGVSGYASSYGDWGLSLNKLWGDTSYNFGYQLNGGDVSVWDLGTAVGVGDYVDAYISQSYYPDTEAYTKFDVRSAAIEAGEPLELTLFEAGYDDFYNMVFSACEGAAITANGFATEVVTGADGKATISFDTAGAYIISATKTNIVNGATVTAITAPACVVTVAGGDGGDGGEPAVPATPVISYMSERREFAYKQYQTADALEISATAEGASAAAIKCEWYANSERSTEGGARAGDGKRYTPPTDATGTVYYYCKVTNRNGSLSAIAYSDIYTVNVTAESPWDGEGTPENPYLIEDIDGLNLLFDAVDEGRPMVGVCFEMTGDITLPEGWAPIGTLKSGASSAANGANINPFSGTFDGGGYTISIPAGGLPLFGYVREAAIQNLDIFGAQIAGYGLINNYTVDYGADGAYDANSIPAAATIDNVTIKSGSSVLYSGFVGGYASGHNTVTIINSTVEAGVVIGYGKTSDNIGSFAGEFNGSITNSVSYATVYGATAVGGLVGGKGQAVGLCSITNSAFLGMVEATGNNVGGIIGRGFDGAGTAPGTAVVTVTNCYVAADISGADSVGGIIGSEPGRNDYSDDGSGYISNNFFYGTVGATWDYVGAIAGSFINYNKSEGFNGNFYLDTCGAEAGIGGVDAAFGAGFSQSLFSLPKTAAEFADGSVTALLNTGEKSSGNWVNGDSYPVFGSGATAYRLTLGGEFKTSYTVGEAFSSAGMIITALYTDGTTQTVPTKEVEFGGFDSGTRGDKTVTVSYGGLEAVYTVTVLYEDSGSEPRTITVYFALYGDTDHTDPEDGGSTHTMIKNNLEMWLARRAYTVSINATVLDVLETALTAAGDFAWASPDGSYIKSITYNGVKLEEFANGAQSGWMYLLNSERTLLSADRQYLANGDSIVFHFTDDYPAEYGSEQWVNPPASGGATPTTETVEGETPLTAAVFADVSKDSWFYEAVTAAVGYGLFNGVSATEFAPNSKMTRAMLVTVLYRMEGKPEVGAENLFTDVAADKWYTDAVIWASDNGIVEGYGDSIFGTNDNVTREQIATIMLRYAEWKRLDVTERSELGGFEDISEVSAWALDAMKWANAMELITGVTATTLLPDGMATRAQVATILVRFIEQLP